MKTNRFIACLLCVMVTLNFFSFTYATIRASYYIEDYYCYISKNGFDTIGINCQVYGTDLMDKIGVTSVLLEEKVTGTSTWRTVKVYDYFVYPNMMINNSAGAGVVLSYAGNESNSYRATVTIYAEKNGGSDVRTFTVYS